MKFAITRLVVAAATLAAVSTTAPAEEARLIFGTTNPPQVHANYRVFKPWVARINEQGKGVLSIDQRDDPSLANFLNYYDRVVNDVVQISWGVQTYLGTKFEKSAVAGLPFMPGEAVHRSVAYWRLLQTGLLDSEYADLVPLMVNSFVHSGVHLVRAPKTLDNLQGEKIITGSKVTSQLVTRLGGAPVTLPLSDVYAALQRSTADGLINAYTAFQPFKLDEVTHYHVDNVPFGANTGAVFMAKKKYDSLSEAARKVIDANRGEKESRTFGAFWDAVQAEGLQYTKEKPNHTFLALTPEQTATWRRHAEAVLADWSKNVPDGERILATFRDLLAKVLAEEGRGAQR